MSPALFCYRRRLASPFKRLFLRPPYFSTTTANTESKPSGSSPPPIQVLLTESAGRGVFATRRIGAGELIHTAQPILSHPSLSSVHCVCYFCLKKLDNAETSHLQTPVSFCSDSCREQAKGFYEVENQADWSAFDEHCRFKISTSREAVGLHGYIRVTSANTLDILQSALLSPEMIFQMEEEFGLLRGALVSADIAGEKITFLTKQWYNSVLARIHINTFHIELVGGSYEDLLSSAAASVNAEAAIGNAIYMLPSFYNHDCDPNAHILWIENVEARLRALRDIEAGEEMRICYIDASMDRDAQQTLLFQGFGFQCQCLRCSSND